MSFWSCKPFTSQGKLVFFKRLQLHCKSWFRAPLEILRLINQNFLRISMSISYFTVPLFGTQISLIVKKSFGFCFLNELLRVKNTSLSKISNYPSSSYVVYNLKAIHDFITWLPKGEITCSHTEQCSMV
jgi:hypothetical protein